MPVVVVDCYIMIFYILNGVIISMDKLSDNLSILSVIDSA
jgi:hypothetical protein